MLRHARSLPATATLVATAALLLQIRCAGPNPFASTAPAAVAAGSHTQLNIPYVVHAHAQQKLDIYAPPGASAARVLMFIHGGEWTKHDKSEVDSKPMFCTTNGVVFVSVNYRLSGTAKHPAQIDDVAAAVRWVHDHIAEYGGDPRQIVLMGHSAGCHLVTLAGLDPRPLAQFGLTPGALRGVVSWSGGAFDLVQKVKDGGLYAGYIRATFGDDEQTWRDASPMNHVQDARSAPAFLFASAEKDRPASIAASRRMVALINAAGGRARAVTIPGKDHTAANRDLGRPGDNGGDILLRVLHDPGAPMVNGATKSRP